MKRFFITRTHREQLLVALLVVLAGLIWASSAYGRFGAQFQAWRSTRGDFGVQQLWLDRKDRIDADAAAAVRSLDPRQTLDPTGLVAQISALAAEAEISPNTEPPKTTNANQLAVHTVQITCRRTSLAALVKFYESIQRKSPYLVLEQCSLTVERGAAGMLNASFVISSIQVATPAAGN